MNNKRVVDFRIPKELKLQIQEKAKDAGITSSEFVRIMIEDYTKFNTILDDNLDTYNTCNEKIRFKLSTDKLLNLELIAKENNVTLSFLIRSMMKVDNYQINKMEYLQICESEIDRAGILLNNIAHELNRKNLTNEVDDLCYEVTTARLIEPYILISNLSTLLMNPPIFVKNTSPERKQIIHLYKKEVQAKWACKIYRTTNNLRQISRRAADDYQKGLVGYKIYEKLMDKLLELEQKYNDGFKILCIFNRVVKD